MVSKLEFEFRTEWVQSAILFLIGSAFHSAVTLPNFTTICQRTAELPTIDLTHFRRQILWGDAFLRTVLMEAWTELH